MLATWGAQGVSPEEIAAVFDALPGEVPGAYGANFVLRFVDPGKRDDCLRAAAERARVVECFYSDPDPAVVAVVHVSGALASWQVGSREEALSAQEAGCDFIVAQGSEAGGHVRGSIGLLALLDEVLAAVEVPVVAAGGIGSGRAMAAALAAGADGVRVGTRFIAAEETGAHPRYLEQLFAARASDSVLDRGVLGRLAGRAASGAALEYRGGGAVAGGSGWRGESHPDRAALSHSTLRARRPA